jgi:HAD superfamily hydrolase (TIGR01509 family)
MIKLIIFDMDGVLVESKKIHYDTFNTALKEIDPKYAITPSENISIYDGLNSIQKLELLTKNKGLNPSLYDTIWFRKQHLMIEALSNLKPKNSLIEIFKTLSDKGYKLACCSNSTRKSVLLTLAKIGLIEYMELILSASDVKNSKPHPEIYWKAMSMLSVLPDETLIVEDSTAGILSAKRSGASVLAVNSPEDLVLSKIFSKLD